MNEQPPEGLSQQELESFYKRTEAKRAWVKERLDNLDKHVEFALRYVKLKNKKWAVVLVAEREMKQDVIASCNPGGFIRFNYKFLNELEELNFKKYGRGRATGDIPYMAAASDPRSTLFHELVHAWQFEQTEGMEDEEKIEFLRKTFLELQKEMGLSKEDVRKISQYLADRLDDRNFAEAHAELWTHKILGEIRQIIKKKRKKRRKKKK